MVSDNLSEKIKKHNYELILEEIENIMNYQEKSGVYIYGGLGFILNQYSNGISIRPTLENKLELNMLLSKIENYIETGKLFNSYAYQKILEKKGMGFDKIKKIYGRPRLNKQKDTVLFPITGKKNLKSNEAKLFIPFGILGFHLLYHGGEQITREIDESQIPKKTTRKQKTRTKKSKKLLSHRKISLKNKRANCAS